MVCRILNGGGRLRSEKEVLLSLFYCREVICAQKLFFKELLRKLWQKKYVVTSTSFFFKAISLFSQADVPSWLFACPLSLRGRLHPVRAEGGGGGRGVDRAEAAALARRREEARTDGMPREGGGRGGGGRPLEVPSDGRRTDGGLRGEEEEEEEECDGVGDCIVLLLVPARQEDGDEDEDEDEDEEPPAAPLAVVPAPAPPAAGAGGRGVPGGVQEMRGQEVVLLCGGWGRGVAMDALFIAGKKHIVFE